MTDVFLPESVEPSSEAEEPLKETVSFAFLVLLALASFVMWMGLIPLTQTIIPTHMSILFSNPDAVADKYRYTSLLQAFGGLSAMIVYPLVGALSDRTHTRFGRRKPWIAGGVLGAGLMLIVLANAYVFWLVAVSWICFCIFACMTQSSIFTLIPDQIPTRQRAKASALIGLSAPLGIIAGTIIAARLGKEHFQTTYYIIAVVEVVVIAIFVSLLREKKPEHEIAPFHFLRFLTGFWINPRTYPDFARVWWARLLFILGYATVQNYLIFFLQDTGLFTAQKATLGVATFQSFSTVGLLLGSFGTGYLSDRWMRRKPFAVIAGISVTCGLLIIAFVPSWPIICFAAFIFGMGFGIYSSTEVALGTQVLTSERSHGKDMGVLSLGGNIPQTLAPLYASLIITTTHSYMLMFGLAAIPPLFSSFFITRIKKVR